MLVLSRKPGERVRIGPRVVVTVVALKGRRVRLAFEAPDDVAIFREEVAAVAGVGASRGDRTAGPL